MAMEREIKLAVADGFELPSLDGVGGVAAVERGSRVLEATYWDTDSLALFTYGRGLRYRTRDGADGTWTLKGPSTRAGGDAVEREELEAEGSPHAIPDAVQARVVALAGDQPLHPVAVVRNHRRVVDLTIGGRPVAELVDDHVTVLDPTGREATRFREVEVELSSGSDPGAVEAVIERLRAAGATADPTGKYARALLALGLVEPSQIRR